MNDKINYDGKFYTKKELASLFNVKYGTFIAKMQRGWTLEEIKNGYRNNGCGYGGIEYNGKIYSSKKQICEEYHLSYRELNNVLNNKNVNDKKIEINGVFYKNKKEATQQLKCSIRTLNKILDNKIELKDNSIVIQNKKFKNKKELANFYNINYYSMLNKLNFGWTIEQIIGIENPPNKINIDNLDINELSKQYNIDKDIIIKKIKMGYILEKAVLPLNNRSSKIKCNGKTFNSITEMAKYYNKPVKLIYNRLNTNWTPEEAVELKRRNTNE